MRRLRSDLKLADKKALAAYGCGGFWVRCDALLLRKLLRHVEHQRTRFHPSAETSVSDLQSGCLVGVCLILTRQFQMTLTNLVGKLRISRLGTLMPCCAFLRRDILRTSLNIQRSGVVTRRNQRNSAFIPNKGIFMPAISSYGGCAWDAPGRAGFLGSRFTTLRTAASLSCGNEYGSSSS